MEYKLIQCIALGLLGLCLGSFVAASVWRLRAKQIVYEKKQKLKVDPVEYKKLSKLVNKNFLNDRSVCLSCSYHLRWYDMVPFFSWIFLRGKCRKCHSKIGYMEILAEIGLAVFFVMSFLFWPNNSFTVFQSVQFYLWLIAGVLLAILFFYDLKWLLMPDKINYSVMLIGLLNATLLIFGSNDKVSMVVNILLSIVVLFGLYIFLYAVSRGRWVGFGDVKLCLGLSLMLANWELALLTLFLANLIGCFVTLPGLISGKLKKTSHIPFGPFLIVGFVIAGLFGQTILNLFFFNLM